MSTKNIFRVQVEKLDAQQGYLVRGTIDVAGAGPRIEVNEHYDTEAAVRTRLGTGFDFWIAQVNAS